MSSCPVCNQPITGMLCEACGFDRSTDYENHPTLSPLSSGLPSVSGRIRRDSTASAGLFSCPGCGGRQFSISIPLRACICAGCGQSVGLDRPLEEAGAWKTHMESLAQIMRSRRSDLSRREKAQPPAPSREQQFRDILAALSRVQANRQAKSGK